MSRRKSVRLGSFDPGEGNGVEEREYACSASEAREDRNDRIDAGGRQTDPGTADCAIDQQAGDVRKR